MIKLEDNLEENDDNEDIQIQDDSVEFLLEEEKILLNMPSLSTLTSDLKSLEEERRLSLYPIGVDQLFSSDILKEMLTSDCHEVTINLVRPKNSPDNAWAGYVTLDFNSGKEAKLMSSKIKDINSDIQTSCDAAQTKFKSLNEWLKDEKQDKSTVEIGENVLLVCNLSELVTADNLCHLFPHSIASKFKQQTTLQQNRQAYILFESSQIALDAAIECYKRRDELKIDGHQLHVCKYVQPRNIFRDLLMLHERYLILHYIERLNKVIEANVHPQFLENPDLYNKRLSRCLSVIEKDSEVRLSAGLTPPTLAHLQSIKKLKGSAWTEVLVKHKIIEKPTSFSGRNAGDSRSYQSRDRKSHDWKSQEFRTNNRKLTTEPQKTHEQRQHKNTKFDNRSTVAVNGNSLLGEPPRPPSLTSMAPIIPPLLLLHNNIMGMMQNGIRNMNWGFEHEGGRGREGNRFNWNNMSATSSNKFYATDLMSGQNKYPNRR